MLSLVGKRVEIHVAPPLQRDRDRLADAPSLVAGKCAEGGEVIGSPLGYQPTEPDGSARDEELMRARNEPQERFFIRLVGGSSNEREVRARAR